LLDFVPDKNKIMPHRLRSFLLLFFYLLQFLTSKEQTRPPEYSIVNYNSDNALPQNSINDMAFDRNGFLWLATEMGVVRFDGKNFREYNMSNSPALSSNRCSLINLAEGSRKILIETWFGSHQILTVTADYQLEADSLLSANPHQYNRSDDQLFSFASIYKKWAGGPSPSPFKNLLNNLEIIGNFMHPTDAYRRLLDLLRVGRLDISPIVPKVFPLVALPEAMEAAAVAQSLECVVIRP